jgi:hypothetical protein
MSIAPRNNKLRPIHSLESKKVAMRREYEPETRTAIPHIGIKERLGLNPLLICKHCTAQLEVDYSVPQMRRRLDEFCDEHEECKKVGDE